MIEKSSKSLINIFTVKEVKKMGKECFRNN